MASTLAPARLKACASHEATSKRSDIPKAGAQSPQWHCPFSLSPSFVPHLPAMASISVPTLLIVLSLQVSARLSAPASCLHTCLVLAFDHTYTLCKLRAPIVRQSRTVFAIDLIVIRSA